jgi:predicted site-specific integrase-resolvase
MRPVEVAAIFRVDDKTPARWAAAGQITAATTPGGHKRFRRADIAAIVGEDVLAGKDSLLTPSEVAAIFRVDDKTPARWAVAGRINSIRTPSGHHRFFKSEVKQRIDTNELSAKGTPE